MTHVSHSDSEVFRAAVELEPEQREAFLDRACGDNSRLRDEVESLLRAHDQNDSFLQRPVVAVTTAHALSERPGTMVGPYKIREQIGEGGFGVVYVAEQEKPVRRKVALKVIKLGMDTRDVIARFEAERQALALMDHPNVARVLDAGASESGRPYFVMELVQGVMITEFCDRNRLPARARVELFIDVCRAVQHAHQKGIIHRDLKPSNIMVTLHDGKPVVKVIDFGVSKALSQQLTEKSIYTAYGQMIGTPSYMSPEQAEMSGLGIDTRSDIYSLGVLLYELLTGRTPLDANRLRASGYAEIMRIIREEEPPRPSLRVSTLGDQATVIAQARQTDPQQLRRDLFGELDWIVMKCLEKDRSRRYETANGLARDIERFLSNEPVEACPPSLGYRFRKLARKHRGLLTTATSLLALLVVGVIASSWFAARALRSERTTQQALRETEQALEREQMAHQEAESARQREQGFANRLRQATQLANDGVSEYYRGNWALAYDHFAEAEVIQADLKSIYDSRAMLFTTLGLWEHAVNDYDRRLSLGNRSRPQTLYEHALLKQYLGEESAYRQVCQEMSRQYGRSSGNDLFHYVHACLLSSDPVGDATVLARQAESLVESVYTPPRLAIAGLAHLRAGSPERAVNRLSESISRTQSSAAGQYSWRYSTLSIALHQLGRADEARDALQQAELAIDKWTNEMAEGPVGTMPINWCLWLESLAHYREAKQVIAGSQPPADRRLQEIHDRALATAKYGDQFTFMQAGRSQVERQEWDQAAAQFVKVLDQLPPGFRASSQAMGMCVEMVQQPEVFDRLVAQRPRDTRIWYARGRLFASNRDWPRAAADYVQAISRLDREAPVIVRASRRLELAAICLLAGDKNGCREMCRSVVAEQSVFNDEFSPHLASRTCTLMPNAVDDPAVAVKLAQRSVDANPSIAWYQWALGAACYRAGEFEGAEQALETSLDVHPAWVGRGQIYIALALVCQRRERHDEARQWLKQARIWFHETNQRKDASEYGFAASDYLSDWLTALVLLPEAEGIIDQAETSMAGR